MKRQQFRLNETFRASSRRALSREFPSNILYSFAAALFDRTNKTRIPAENAFYRKVVDRVMQTVKSIRALEEQYYV